MVFRLLALFIFKKILGWKIEGDFDNSIKKYIVIVAPHTSNWDFPIGVLARSIVRISDAKFLGKKALFRWPYGWIFRAFGGYPVDRSKHNNLVEAVVDIFDGKEKFAVALAPEGTRSKVSTLKTGFYYIAQKADIPIYMVGFDYSTKKVIISKPFYPTGIIEDDMPKILDFYRPIKGKNPAFGL